MRHLKIAGLCLVSMFAMHMVVSAAASAAGPVWELCETEKASEAKTKYTGGQCTTGSGTGKWAWQEVTGTEIVIAHGSLTIKDTKVPVVGTVEITCVGMGEILIGPGKFAKILSVSEASCKAGKGCEEFTDPSEPRNLPWQLEAFEEAGKVRGKITDGKSGKEAPGAEATCKVLGLTDTDECNDETGTALLENKSTAGILLVLADLESKSGKAKCSLGGAESGVVEGTVTIFTISGGGLRLS